MEIFYGTLIFQQVVSLIVLATMLEGKTTFCFDLVKRLIVTLRYAVNIPTSTSQHFP